MKKIVNIKKVLIVVGAIYISYTLIHQQVIMANQKKELTMWQSELQKVKNKNEVLKDEVKLSETKKYTEKQAREKLGLTKEGEILIVNNHSDSLDD